MVWDLEFIAATPLIWPLLQVAEVVETNYREFCINNMIYSLPNFRMFYGIIQGVEFILIFFFG